MRNGTFFNNGDFFPSLGYSNDGELRNIDKRKKYHLPVRDTCPTAKTHPGGSTRFWHPQKIRFESVVSTDTDQVAIAPVTCKRNGRSTTGAIFHYKMDAPIFNFYNIVSAKFAVKKKLAGDQLGNILSSHPRLQCKTCLYMP